MLRNVRLLHIHNFLTDFAPHWPFQVIYFADICGSYTIAMSVLALETFSAALFDIPTGVFSDRIGRRVTMATGSFCCAISIACYAFGTTASILYIGALFQGLGQCLFSGNNNALLYETLQAENLERNYHHYRGTTGSMFQAALCLSAFASIWLSHYGLRTIFYVAVVPQVLNIFVSLMFEEPRAHIKPKTNGLHVFRQAFIQTWNNPRLFWLVMAKALNYGSGEAKFKFQSAFVNTLWPLWGVGLYRGLNHGLSFFGFRSAGYLIEKFGEPAIFVMRDVYWFITQMVAITLNVFVSPLLILTGAYWFGPGEVASDHLMQKDFTDDERATMGSISSFVTSIMFTIVSLALGLVSDQFGIRIAFALGIGLTVTSLPINVWLFRKNF